MTKSKLIAHFKTLAFRLRRAASVLKHGSDRLDAVEAQLQRLHARSEQVQKRFDGGPNDLTARLDQIESATILNRAVLTLTNQPKSNTATKLLQLPEFEGTPRISIVINTYNRRDVLQKTLNSLRFLRTPNVEVIVVNGPSTDGTAEMLKTNWANAIKIVPCPDRNLARSRNLGVAAANGEIVAFLDDDAVPEPDWLEQLIKGYDHAYRGGVGGFARDASGVSFQIRHLSINRFGDADIDRLKALAPQEQAAFSPEFTTLIGANSSFRRTALSAIGGFDERYSFWLEEADVVARMIDGGYQVCQIPDAEVHHAVAPGETRDVSGRTTAWNKIARSRAYFSLVNATPGVDLVEVFTNLSVQLASVKTDLRQQLMSSDIDKPTYERLTEELECGAAEGIRQALSETPRQLVTIPPPPQRKLFPLALQPDARLKIAFVTGLYPPRPLGGVAVFIMHLAHEMARAGHEVTLLTFAAPDANHSVSFENGIWVHRLPLDKSDPTGNVLGTPKMPPLRMKAAAVVLNELDRINARRQFDWVVGGLWDVDVAAAIASKRYKVALYLVTSMAMMAGETPDAETTAMIHAERWALQNADLILASTKAIRADLANIYGIEISDKNSALVPFGVPQQINEADGHQQTSENNSKKKTGVKLLFVGRFERRKGIDLLLACLPALLEAHSDLEVCLVGDNTLQEGADTPYWDAFVERYQSKPWLHRIVAAGVVSDAERDAHLATCDIFVAPSRYESFGLIYLEAMRNAKPSIGTNSGGIPEVITDKVEGLLVPPGDSGALGQALKTLITDPALRERLGDSARERYLEDFTISKFAENFVKTLRD